MHGDGAVIAATTHSEGTEIVLFAIDVAAEIMENKDNNPAIRLQAAQTILNNASKFNAWLQQGESHARSESSKDPLDVY